MRYQILRVCDELIITEQEVTIMQLNTFIKKWDFHNVINYKITERLFTGVKNCKN